jgi:hypothetical protein
MQIAVVDVKPARRYVVAKSNLVQLHAEPVQVILNADQRMPRASLHVSAPS